MLLEDFLMINEAALRLGFFLGIFAAMAVWEVFAPRRVLLHSKRLRWGNNLGLVVLNTLILRMVFPAAAVGMGLLAQELGWGLFNYVDAPFWLAVLASVLVLDFFIWLQHVMVHAVPLLWRLHRVHHADLDFDVTTGLRFHPLEILLSMLIKFAVILLLGPPLVAIVIFEILLNATSMFNHSNVRIPVGIDRVLRWLVVTPDMHRVHHSVEDDETNSNFGFNLPWWDRLLGTYRAQPRAGHQDMNIGIRSFRDEKWCAWLSGILVIPFVGKVTEYAINRRQWAQHEDE
ncbi:MAG: sterol desaturase family protein [Thiogranum sp.]|nr:sterol desaturase family protein [Thiogranum sp.]